MIAGDSDALSVADASIINENIYLSDLDLESRKSFEMVMHDRVARAQGLPPSELYCSPDADLSIEGILAAGGIESVAMAPFDPSVPNSAWRAPVVGDLVVFDTDPRLGGARTVTFAAKHAVSAGSSAPTVAPATCSPKVAEAESEPSSQPSISDASVAAPAEAVAPSTRISISEAFDAFGLEPEVKALAISLFDLRLGLKMHCAEYATGLAQQGVLSVDHLRRVSQPDAWGIIKRAGLKVIPQKNLMRHVFGKAVVDPDREAEDAAVPQEEEEEKGDKNVLKGRMEEQKRRILNDPSEPLTDEQKATLHPEVQRL